MQLRSKYYTYPVITEDADFYKVVRINSLDDEVLSYSTSFFDSGS